MYVLGRILRILLIAVLAFVILAVACGLSSRFVAYAPNVGSFAAVTARNFWTTVSGQAEPAEQPAVAPGEAGSGQAPVTDTGSIDFTAILTMETVKPLIDKMGSGGHPGHDVGGNEQCAYWLDPKYLWFADNTGPDTSGTELRGATGVFRFVLDDILHYKSLSRETIFVIEGVAVSVNGVGYKQVFVVTPAPAYIDIQDGSIYAMHPKSVEAFLALRTAHLKCRGYSDGLVDYRSGKSVITGVGSPAPSNPDTATTPKPAQPEPAANAAISGTYRLGDGYSSTATAQCFNLNGAEGRLKIDLNKGSFAISGRQSDTSGWQIATGQVSGAYEVSKWKGWWICFDKSADEAVKALLAKDPNASGNTRVQWSSAKG